MLGEYLGVALAAVFAAATLAKQRHAEQAEKARLRAIEEARIQRERERHEREAKRHQFLIEMENDYAEFGKLVRLASRLNSQAESDGSETYNRLVKTLNSIVEQFDRRFRREEIESEMDCLGLFLDDDAV